MLKPLTQPERENAYLYAAAVVFGNQESDWVLQNFKKFDGVAQTKEELITTFRLIDQASGGTIANLIIDAQNPDPNHRFNLMEYWWETGVVGIKRN